MKRKMLLYLLLIYGCISAAYAHKPADDETFILAQHGEQELNFSATICAVPDSQMAKEPLGEELANFLPGLLDTHQWPARWNCGSWSPFLGWLYISSDVLIWLAYFAIPLILLFFVSRQGSEVPFRAIFLWFIGFILACGLTHLIDAAIFWWPAYRLSAFIRFCTAFVSLGTVVALTKVIPKALELRNPDILEKVVQQRTAELRSANEQLAHEIYQRKEAEVEILRLNKSLSDFQNAVNVSSIISKADRKGTITFVNENFVKISGYSKEELVGQNHNIINSGYHKHAFWKEMWATIGKGKPWRREVKNKAKDGTYYWVDTFIIPFLNEEAKVEEYLSIRNDITDRKQHEEQLHFQANLLENVSDAIIVTDEEFTITHWNSAAEALYGWDSMKVIGKSVPEVLKTDFLRNDRQNIIHQLREEGHWQNELIQHTMKGEPIYIHASLSLIKDRENQQTGIVSVNRDITPQKIAEQALQKSEKRLQQVVDNLDEGLVLADDSGQFLQWNKAAIAMHGFSSEAESYAKVSEYQQSFELSTLEGTLLPLDKWPLSRLLQQQPLINMEIEVHILPKKWRRIFSYDGGSITDEDGTRLHFMTISDITKRKKAEKALQDSESRLKQLIESLPQLVWTCLPDGQCDYLSKQWVAYTGIPEKEQLGFKWLDQIHPDDREATAQSWAQAVENSTDFRTEFRIRHHQGNYRWFDTIATRLYDSDNQLVKWFGTNTDIEDRRKATLEIHRLNDELEQRVVERTAQLEAANKELEAFSYSVSHDLRAPLRHINGYADLLVEDYQDQLDGEAKEMLYMVRNKALVMGDLIDDLLKFSRIGRVEMNNQTINMTRLIHEVSQDLLSMEDQQNVSLKIQHLENVKGDYPLLKQVWVNLISNAIKYSAHVKEPCIEIGSEKQPREILYYIKDNGVGFDMKHIDKLFKVFQRLHKGRDFEGTGVGLALVQRIIHRHGGDIWAEATVNQGATFYFNLPK